MRNTLHTDKHKCMHLVCRHLTIRHLSHLFLSFSTCVSLCVNGVMANCCILSVFLHLCLFLPLSTFLSSCLSVSFLALLTSSPLSLLCTLPLSSPPCLSLLPLFRLCKVQLGFGAFGLQAWRQEDALSEYALLGSLCVTLYFFALSLFTRRPYLLFSSFFSFTPISVKSRSSCLPAGFLLRWRTTLCF